MEARLQRFQAEEPLPDLDPELRSQLEDLGRSLPRLWERLSSQHQKALLRTLVQRVVLKRVVRERIQVRVVWVSGHVSTLEVTPPIHRLEDLSTYPELLKEVEELFHQGETKKSQSCSRKKGPALPGRWPSRLPW